MAEIAPDGKQKMNESTVGFSFPFLNLSERSMESMMTSVELAEKMKADILKDVAEGVVPKSVKSFSELHDYVDANTYGGTEGLLDELTAGAPQTEEGAHGALMLLIEIMNPAIEIVDCWIRNSGIVNKVPEVRAL